MKTLVDFRKARKFSTQNAAFGSTLSFLFGCPEHPRNCGLLKLLKEIVGCLPVGCKESFPWIILKTILCLVLDIKRIIGREFIFSAGGES